MRSATFFEHLDSFFDYRKSICETSSQTFKSNRIDLNLFQNFITVRRHTAIDLVIQSLLGHSTPRSTEAHIHPSQKKIREAMEKLPAQAGMTGAAPRFAS